MNWRWWLALNVGLLAFILGVYKFDLLEEILTRDTTYITTTMMVAALITSITTKGKTWTHWHEFVTDLMPRVGLIGTVIGFMISLDASSVAESLETIDDVKTMIVVVLSGMSVALTTTLAGLVLQVWLDVQKRSIRDTEA
jgi:flagellar motor component MotA